MTKLLHVADVHAGILTHSRPDPITGLPSSLEASLRCFEAVVDLALEQKVDAVIVAGDVYHSPNPVAAAVVGMERQIARLRDEDVPTLIYPGNHDRAPRGEGSIVNVHAGGTIIVVEEPTVLMVEFGVVVGVLPSVARQSGGSRAEADEQMVETLQRQLGEWAEHPGHYAVDVVTGHWPVAGSMLGGEKDIAMIDEPMLSPVDLEGPWRYAAMGHIHRAQAITRGGGNVIGAELIGAYSGAIDRFNFGEEDYKPVALIVDLEDRLVTEVALPARIFRTIEMRSDSALQSLDAADLTAANEGGIIRIRGRFPEGGEHRAAVATAREVSEVLYNSGASIVRIEVEAIRADRVRVVDIAKAPTELEALDLWIKANDVDPDLAAALRDYAGRLVAAAP